MSKTPFIIKQLEIHKMPGFRKGIHPFKDLANHINIITGPNASGKSSTARAMQQVIWQDEDNRDINAESSGTLGKDQWRIEIDHQKAIVQRNGINERINVPTKELKNRYLLSLPQLIREEEHDIAREIAKQASGGYDLEEVHQILNYSDKAKTTNNNEYRIFRENSDRYNTALKIQADLKKEEDSLSELRAKEEQAKESKRKVEFYKVAADYVKRKTEFTLLEAQLNAFPPAIKKVIGNEFTEIENGEEEIKNAKQAIEFAKYEISKFDKEIQNLSIPKKGVDELTLSLIEAKVQELEELERKLQASTLKTKQLEDKESAILKTIDIPIQTKDWQGVTLTDIAGLDNMMRKAHRVLGKRAQLTSEKALLEDEIKKLSQDENNSSENLQKGIQYLSAWLKEPVEIEDTTQGVSRNALAIITFIGVITVILSVFLGQWGLIGILVILGTYFYLLKAKNVTTSHSSLSIRQKDYEQLGIRSISHWDTKNVTENLEELIALLKNKKQVEHHETRLRSLQNLLNENDSHFNELHTESESWRAKLQTIPSIKEIESNDYSSLVVFITAIKNWQEANIEKIACQIEEKILQERLEKNLESINTLLKSCNFEEIQDANEGKVSFKALQTQEYSRRNYTKDKESKEREILEKTKSKEKAEDKLKEIYETLELPIHSKREVQLLVTQKATYMEAEKAHALAKRYTSESFENLKNYSYFKNLENKITLASIDQIEEEINLHETKASKLEEIQKEITAIETKIQEKTKGNELEYALAEKEKALESLETLREENISDAVGDLIIKHLKKETESKNQPEVFTRANQILNYITNGRYKLLINYGENTGFRAYDTVFERGQDLTELSTGTRIQLLLAVRIAYIESVESSIALPLLADELLANSDDERAKSIIETLIKISETGRQVFYFTAQSDEVKKWQEHLRKHENSTIDHQIIQLKEGGESFTDSLLDDFPEIRIMHSIQPPSSMSHIEYKDEIEAPPFNLLSQHSSELHLWYLIEDTQTLYSCLEKGIKTWGQLQSFMNINGKIESISTEYIDALHKKIKVLDRFKELYQQGRYRPIDRAVLHHSGAVSSNFIDLVSEKSEELKNNPKLLLESLKNGEVPRFSKSKINDLEAYLIEYGYIDVREELEKEEIMVQLQAIISNLDIETGQIEQFLNRVIHS